ncbi:hypothetical protein [Bifidobacterium miconisargentati]|uniref:hypothetical protein n=1 Tax=Bifidobacterium miconisargentati TaxID=2834437 RepID=UPI001F171546|nr:hypothetical protein [Bifidobacterium miconisargentati]
MSNTAIKRTVSGRLVKVAAAIATAAIALGLCMVSNDNVSAAIKERRVERLNAQIESVYTTDYQQMMDDQLTSERDAKERKSTTSTPRSTRTAPTPRPCTCTSPRTRPPR